jgi:hypothetical protein
MDLNAIIGVKIPHVAKIFNAMWEAKLENKLNNKLDKDELNAQLGESIAVLEGETFEGIPIRGEDTIRIVISI